MTVLYKIFNSVLCLILMGCTGELKTKKSANSRDQIQIIEIEKEKIKMKNLKINETKKDTSNRLKKVLEQQLIKGYATSYLDDTPNHELVEEDFKATIPILKKELQRHGFNFNIAFTEKVKAIFGGYDYNDSFTKLSLLYKCNKEFFTYSAWVGDDLNNLIILNNQSFITHSFYIPQLLNYSLVYPEFSKTEDSIRTQYPTEVEGEYIKIIRWKDIQNLDKERKFNIELLVNRNKYLFNDDKSKLPWLLQNDEHFLETLVTSFGWTSDRKLVGYFLDKYLLTKDNFNEDLYKHEKFGSVLWHKNCNGKLIINNGALQAIKEISTPENTKYLEALYMYIYTLERNKELSFENYSEIYAHLLYFGEKHYKYAKGYAYDYLFMTHFSYFNSKEYLGYESWIIEEIAKNNYYNLPDFKVMLEKATKEGTKIQRLIDEEIIERGEEEFEFGRIAEELGRADVKPLTYPHKKYYGID